MLILHLEFVSLVQILIVSSALLTQALALNVIPTITFCQAPLVAIVCQIVFAVPLPRLASNVSQAFIITVLLKPVLILAHPDSALIVVFASLAQTLTVRYVQQVQVHATFVNQDTSLIPQPQHV